MRDFMRDVFKNVRRLPVHSQVVQVDFRDLQVLVAKNFLSLPDIREVGGEIMAQSVSPEVGDLRPLAMAY